MVARVNPFHEELRRKARVSTRRVARSVGEFSKAVDDWTKRLKTEFTPLVAKVVGMDILNDVVLATPVDTGRARGNWQVEIGTPATGEIEGFPKSTKHKTGQPTNGNGASLAAQTIAKGSAKINGLRTLDIIWISNNLEYILALEGGHSQQAPSGMLHIAINNTRARFL